MKKVYLVFLLVLVIGVGFACVISGFPPAESDTPEKEVEPIGGIGTLTPTPTLYPTPLSPMTFTVPMDVQSVQVITGGKGDEAFFYGDWDEALKEYTLAYQNSNDEDAKSAALLGLGRTRFMMGNYGEALNAFRSIVNEYPESPVRDDAYFQMGQTYNALSRYQEAADAYAAYLALNPGVIDSYVYEWRGDALRKASDFNGAIENYQDAIASPRLGNPFSIQVKIGETYTAMEDYQTAIVVYTDVYSHTTNDYQKAQVDYLIGQAYLELGQTEAAYQAFLDAVENYPLAYSAYLALVELVDAGYDVSEFDRGLIDYYAKQYSLSIAAFDRYLAETGDKADIALYYKGLSFLALGDYQNAIDSWQQLIDSYPDSSYLDRAVDEEAYAYWGGLGDYQQAVNVLLEFVKNNPWHERAAEFLFMAARIQERGSNLAEAAQIWGRIAPEYPKSDYTTSALFQVGLMYYRLGEFDKALTSFQIFFDNVADIGQQAKGNFWIAKCYQKLGDSQSAQNAFRVAANLDPTGYYSERARDILLNRGAFEPPQVYDIGVDLHQEAVDAEQWIRNEFDIDSQVDISSLGTLASDPRFIRGDELWRLGEYELARLEFEDLRKDVASDPVNSYRLASYLVDLGLYRSAIFAARQVLNLAGLSDAETFNAPIWFNHVRFGLYYRELVLPLAEAYDFHPLFLFSVIRQESLFEGFVFSSAGAMGLMQIVPSTGATIVSQIGWPEALAAYNAGPGNAAIWKSIAGEDKDLFLEVIRYRETRNYIKGIYEIFAIYRRLYGRTP